MIYLASRSPRRAELLQQIAVDFSVFNIEIDESGLPGETAVDYVCRMAQSKAREAARQLAPDREEFVVLGADTIISLDGGIIGKPSDEQHCRSILRQLSARQHHVLSAVVLATASEMTMRLSLNRVSFRALNSAEIDAYSATAEPYDKAGAYAIQGRAAIFIDHLEGSYSSVMGLPLFETAELLSQANIELFTP
mgnify:FL=1|tara:strand:- start:140 stop:721 length:582 start_codon:yes stop_codon:yes gene_type:complete